MQFIYGSVPVNVLCSSNQVTGFPGWVPGQRARKGAAIVTIRSITAFRRRKAPYQQLLRTTSL